MKEINNNNEKNGVFHRNEWNIFQSAIIEINAITLNGKCERETCKKN